MKRLITSILIIIFATYALGLSAFAAENSVNFELSDESAKPGRLVTFEMKAKSSEKLCAASFEFTYDSSMLEYRSSKVKDKESKIKANDTGGKVRLIFLNSNGKNISSGEVIFTLTFKAVSEGSSFVDFTVKQCVDDEVNWIDAGYCKSASIKVSKNINEADKSKSDLESDKKKNNKSSSVKSKRSAQSNVETTATFDEWGNLNPIDDKNIRYLYIGLAGGASFVSLAILAYAVIKRIKGKNKKENNAENGAGN